MASNERTPLLINADADAGRSVPAASASTNRGRSESGGDATERGVAFELASHDDWSPDSSPAQRTTSWGGAATHKLIKAHDLYNSAPSQMTKTSKLNHDLPLASAWQASVNIAKAIVGAGSFSLPWAFMNMGLIGGSVTLIVVSIISVYTIDILVKCKRHVAKLTLSHHLTYVDVMREAAGDYGAALVYALMIAASMGVSGAYLVFIGSTLNSIWPNISQFYWTVLVFPVVLGLSLLRSFHYLSFTSILGDISLLLGMGTTMYYGFRYESLGKLSDYHLFEPDTYFLSFGSVAFLFVVHFLVFPIEKSMRKPTQFRGALSAAVAAVFVTNIAFAILGYMFFGPSTCSIVLLNLGNATYIKIVKICLCVDLTFTYAITFAPGREIVEKTFLDENSTHVESKRNFIRFLLCVVCLGFAQIKSFGIATNLIGGFAMCSLGLIIPPLLHVYFNKDGMSTVSIGLHFLIAVGGVGAVVMTTFVTIQSLFKDTGNGSC